MIIKDKVKNSWDIYSADEFQKEFNIEEARDETECDEDYIMRHLEQDSRKFRVTFMESARHNAYEQYWKIEEI